MLNKIWDIAFVVISISCIVITAYNMHETGKSLDHCEQLINQTYGE